MQDQENTVLPSPAETPKFTIAPDVSEDIESIVAQKTNQEQAPAELDLDEDEPAGDQVVDSNQNVYENSPLSTTKSNKKIEFPPSAIVEPQVDDNENEENEDEIEKLQ